MRTAHVILGLAVAFCAPQLRALDYRVIPPRPTLDDRVRIEIRECAQGGTLHWGVNARGNQWQQAIGAYRPEGSTLDGIATRTPLEGPDEQGACSAELGPFNDTNQLVGTVDFAIQWADGTWDTAGGKDYHIDILWDRIRTEPDAPGVNDPLRVSVRRSAPGGLLRWGVNADHGMWSRPHSNYWPAGTLPSDDGLAVDTPLPPPDENGVSTVLLGPFDDGAQFVSAVHMAVHWGDVWDTDFGRNYNVKWGGGREALILSPSNGVSPSAATAVRVAGPAPVTLWLDGEPAVTLLDSECEWLPPDPLSLGRHTLVARRGERGAVEMQELDFWLVPGFRVQAVPPGTPFGATEGSDGTVTFALYAPGKRFVSVVGDFNGWDSQADVMTMDPQGTWWLRRKVPPGTHLYQYCVEGQVFLADPYSTDVEWKDESGAETYRPALARSVLRVGAPPYVWKASGYERPPLENLLIYEFFIEDLCPGQGFTGVIAKLDYIRDLGVNAIEPLPVTEFTGAISWGYNPSFHMAPETTYGTPDELRRLVDEAHKRGLAVIFDVVLNHMDWQSPVFQLYGVNYDASPYFYLFLGENWGFPDLDQESEAFKLYAADLLGFWIREYKADGFRYDATRWVGWSGYNEWGASWFAYAATRVDPDTYQIAEHLPADPVLISETEMDSNWDAEFRWRLRDMLKNGKLDREVFMRIVDPRRMGFSQAVDRVAYTESHDEERAVRDFREAGYGRGDALRRAISALAVTLTVPGVTMVYAGQEFGESTPKVVGPNPLHWENLDNPRYQVVYDAFRKLAHLRTTHPALRSDAVRFIDLPEEDVAAYERYSNDSAVMVAVNFGRVPREVTLPISGPEWQSVIGSGVEMDGGMRVKLPPGESAVFSSVHP